MQVMNKYVIVGTLSVMAAVAIAFIGILNNAPDTKITTQSVYGDYKDICGYPVTHEMRLERFAKLIDSDDSFYYYRLHHAKFTHVEKENYLLANPLLDYWYESDDGRQIYFVTGACDLDNSNTQLVEIGPNYKKTVYPSYDDTKYDVLVAPGYPLIYKDTLKPVLDSDNCKRVADGYTADEKETLFTRENITFNPPWENQVIPLMDYCTSIGTYTMSVVEDHIQWKFTLKE